MSALLKDKLLSRKFLKAVSVKLLGQYFQDARVSVGNHKIPKNI